MRRKMLLLVICLGVILSSGGPAATQPLPKIGPPSQELETLWNGFWEAIRAGDLKGATKYVHSRKRHFLAREESLPALQDVARQMAYCKLDPIPLIFTMLNEEERCKTEERLSKITPEDLERAEKNEDLIYRVRCEHRGETADGQVGVRRDQDGVWRISIL